ncbi:2-amino-4-hydroxy-6-hydroxymethyldihydropteridine diphosphokinase [Candidatus Woesearchaeota archaeon]|nr:2-amino-4-hydroxy-6-hydroxymethyldihydropteridine diphosphokinase [Candidatus Woesearchaeota archaeon]MBW3022274.1 2-amino-4-hydroxy-6-hydroxymethyldihydropteridine diphosphokinase [Candidatus Woesearchaeota archaeon]
MVKAYVGVGTNTGDRERNIKRALCVLEGLFEVSNKSSVYEAEPIGFMYNDWFYNAVVEIETELEPEELLKKLQMIEDQFGRDRSIKYGKVTMDLDLLFYEDKIMERFDLQLPHTKIPDRRFVLLPMAEIAPEFVHPLTHKSMKDMLKDVGMDKSVRKIRKKF